MDVTRRGKPTRMAGSGKRRIRAAIGLRGMPVQRFGERAAGENPLRPVCLLLPVRRKPLIGFSGEGRLRAAKRPPSESRYAAKTGPSTWFPTRTGMNRSANSDIPL
jgi:hypothetical protein